MAHFCLRDDRCLENIGNMEILGRQVNVCRCSGCGEITFWENYEETKKSVKKTLEQAIPVKGN